METVGQELTMKVSELMILVGDYEDFKENQTHYRFLPQVEPEKRTSYGLKATREAYLEFFMNPFDINPERVVDSISVHGTKPYYDLIKENPIWRNVAKKIAERNGVEFNRLNEAYFTQTKVIEKRYNIRKGIERVSKAQQELDERVEREIQRILS